MGALLELRSQLRKIQWFGEVNRKGFVKITKKIDKKVSNICFGGKNGKTCYITLQDRGCLETFKANTAGREWAMMKAFAEVNKK